MVPGATALRQVDSAALTSARATPWQSLLYGLWGQFSFDGDSTPDSSSPWKAAWDTHSPVTITRVLPLARPNGFSAKQVYVPASAFVTLAILSPPSFEKEILQETQVRWSVYCGRFP